MSNELGHLHVQLQFCVDAKYNVVPVHLESSPEALSTKVVVSLDDLKFSCLHFGAESCHQYLRFNQSPNVSIF